tara:strand:- start:1194 stop:1658 length:465 start_codon:yes stop_codon:yes gene_type:complete
MILSIFSNQAFAHSLEIFFWMLGAFLIGLFFGRMMLKNQKVSEINSDKNENDDFNLMDDTSLIRAIKTFERGGKEMTKTVPIIEEATKDDLKKITGIGPSIEVRLNNIGITNFTQISEFKEEDIIKITEQIKFFPGRIKRDDWVGQAIKFLEEK